MNSAYIPNIESEAEKLSEDELLEQLIAEEEAAKTEEE